MRDLSRASGLDLRLDSQKHALAFGKTVVRAPVREVSSLKYRLYGGAREIKDSDILRKNKLRFDLILLRSGSLGLQMPRSPGSCPQGGFPELYEALYGEAWFLLQKENKEDCRVIEDVILVKVKPGRKIIIPPGYGYILINPGKDDLVAAGFSSSRVTCESEKYLKAKGGAYFIFKDNLGEIFEPNPFYRDVPYIRIAVVSARIERFGVSSNEPVYNLLSKGIEKLDFLNNPAKYDYSDVFEFV